jgi:protein SCO1/2
MTQRPASHAPAPIPVDRRAATAGAVALLLLGVLAAGLVALVVLARDGALPADDATGANAAGFTYRDVADAPPLELIDQDGHPFALGSLRGRPVLVFFGYTHCPDVCPATVGVINEALATLPEGPRAVFVSIDPERDDAAAMKSYLRYLPTAYIGLNGPPDAIRRNADAWGVHYAKVETGSAGGYSMAHTADVYLVDAQGRLRAHFPFGVEPDDIATSLRALLAETPPSSAAPATPAPASAAPTSAPGAASDAPAPGSQAPTAGVLRATVVSTSVWAGGESPVILSIRDEAGVPLDGTTAVRVQVVSMVGGSPSGEDVAAVAIRPSGESAVSYVATVDIPSPGSWQLRMTAADGRSGVADVFAMDPGSTAKLGDAAPNVATPTLDDVGGLALAITTVSQPDLRFSRTSTTQATAAGKPYVLVVDSARFKVTIACGRALGMVQYQLDRWTDVVFIHLEPFQYTIITSEPVLSGDASRPPINRWAEAWGLGDATWPSTAMPWIFVVDRSGIVRAKYTGVAGSADVDVILSLITGEGVIAGS